MIVIWRGFGFLVPVVGIAAWLGCRFVVDAVLGEGYYDKNDWPVYFTVGLMCVGIAALGYLLNHRMRREVKDPETGASLGKPPSHSLFFIPIEHWAILVPLLAIWSHTSNAKQDAKDARYLEAPIKGDLYITDLSHAFEEIDSEHKWGVLRVTRANHYRVVGSEA